MFSRNFQGYMVEILDSHYTTNSDTFWYKKVRRSGVRLSKKLLCTLCN